MSKAINYLFFLFIFLLPWQARWVLRVGELNGGFWEYGTIALYATDIFFIVILLLYGARWAQQERNSKSQIPNPKQIPNHKFQIPKLIAYSLLLTAYIFLSILWSSDKLVALYAAVKLLEGIILFFIVRQFQYDEVGLPNGRPTSRISWAIVASAAVQGVLATYQFLTQAVTSWSWSGIAPHMPYDLGASVVQFADERWLRAYGSFPHPNLLGAFLALALLLLFHLTLSLSSKERVGARFSMRYPLLVTGYALLVTGLFFSFSRAAWIAAVFALGYWLWTSGSWRHRLIQQILVALTAYCLLLTAIFWPLVTTRVLGNERLEQRSTIERIAGYSEAWQLVTRHPFLGVGIGNYTAAVHNELRPNDSVWSYQPVHNVFVLILAELGIVGILLLALSFWLLISQLPVTRYWLPVILFILTILDHSFWTLHSGILIFWVFIAFFSTIHRASTDDETSQSTTV